MPPSLDTLTTWSRGKGRAAFALRLLVPGVAGGFGAWLWFAPYHGVGSVLIGAVGLILSLALLAYTSVRDGREQKGGLARSAVVVLPWLAAFELGALGGWLVSRGAAGTRVSAADQQVFGLVILAVVADFILFVHWHEATALLEGRGSSGRQSREALAKLRSWGGGLAPGALVSLSLTKGDFWLTLLAWILLLASHVLWCYLSLKPQKA